jgi:hypothetical protein
VPSVGLTRLALALSDSHGGWLGKPASKAG